MSTAHDRDTAVFFSPAFCFLEPDATTNQQQLIAQFFSSQKVAFYHCCKYLLNISPIPLGSAGLALFYYKAAVYNTARNNVEDLKPRAK